MKKSLVDGLKKGFRNGILVVAGLKLLMGCPLPPNPIPNNNPPEITSSPTVQVDEKEFYSYNVEATDKDRDNLEYSLIQAPEWISLNSNTGLISGTAPEVDSDTDYDVKVKVSDDKDSDYQNFSLKVKNIEDEPPISEPPTVDLSEVDAEVVEGRTINIDLPNPTDSDTPGEIPYTNVESLDGKVIPVLNGKQLTVTANSTSEETNYQVKLTFGSEEGGIGTETLEGKLLNLCDISGKLESNETDTGEKGIIRIYDSLGNPLGYNSTTGDFNIQADSPVLEIILQGAIKEGEELKSYVRTIPFTFDGTKDYSDIIVRAVPYPDFDANGMPDNIENFREHMKEINFNGGISTSGLKKWDLENGLKGIEILLQNPITGDYFTQDNQNFIENKIKASDDIEMFVEGKDLDNYIQKDTASSTPHYAINAGGIGPDDGWIIIAPNNNISGGKAVIGYLNNSKSTGIINKARIELGVVNDCLTTHELGHAFIAPIGEAGSYDVPGPIPSDYTIMYTNGNVLTKPGIADEKASKIVYEDTYQPREKLDDILGMNWMN